MTIKVDTSNAIALALIAQLVKRGLLDADDVAEICEEIPEHMATSVQAAWAEGAMGGEDYPPPKPTLRVVD